MSYALKKGTTSKILLVYALDATDLRSGKTGLSARTSGGSAAYIREGETEVRRITLAEGLIHSVQAIARQESDNWEGPVGPHPKIPARTRTVVPPVRRIARGS